MSHRTRGLDGADLLEFIKSRCIITTSGCWLWGGSATDRGYGSIKYKGKTWRVHRLTAYLAGKGLPDEWDHKCKNTLCCNPKCLEAVTHHENVRRGGLKNVSKKRYENTTHCPHGHPYSGRNLYIDPKGHRRCRECGRLQKLRSYNI